MRLTFRYRLLPNKSQRISLEQTLEICRKVYNNTLAIRRDSWEKDKKSISLYDTNKELVKWKSVDNTLSSVHSQVLQNAQERVDLALKAFFRRVKAKENPGYPRFKGYGRYDSFTFTQYGFKVTGNKLHLSKIGDVKIKIHRPICGNVKTLTVKRDRIGNWYAYFSCDVDQTILPISSEVVGIDLGLTTFATLSNGETIDRQRWMARDEKDIKRIQRRMSKSAIGDSDRLKIMRAFNHAHIRVKNRRHNFSHQESRKIVNRFGIIVFEDLNISRMKTNGNRVINKGIMDVAWANFVKDTSSKAEGAGRGVVLVDPRMTTQMCSSCGAIVQKDLSVRVHHCPVCGLNTSRDLNAAINILRRGLSSVRP